MIDMPYMLRRAGVWLSLAVTLMAASAAHAGLIVSSSTLLQGTSVISDVKYTFNVSGPGTLNVNLTDMVWPASLNDLSFTAATSSSVIGQINGPGQASFDITGGGTIYAFVTGEATNPTTGPAYGLGLFNLNIDFTPSVVPLPASLGLLLLSLMGLALFQPRLRRDRSALHARS
jgi:hypothetical protein